MDEGWEEVARILLPPPGVHAATTPLATMAFDPVQELLWTGNDYGRVTSFYGTELQRYTSFKAHSSADGPVRQLLFHDKGIIALGSKSIHMAMRRGGPVWHITHELMKDLRCMSFTSKGTNEILVAGLQDTMFVIDANKGEITREIHTDDHYTIMKRSRYICAATRKGTVNILDSVTFNLVKTWNAHASMISDMDTGHDFIVTCGYSLRQQHSYMLDPLVNVFDLKKMASLPPIPFPAGAAYVRLHPRMLTTCIVASQPGQFHLVDLVNVNTSNVRHANTFTYLTMIEIAPSGEAVALADAECNIQIWGSPSRVRYAELSNPIESADTDENHLQVDWNGDLPLNTVGMPHYREQLLSAWPSHMITEVGAPPTKIDPQLTAGLKMSDWFSYGPNPRTTRRNQVGNYRQSARANASLQAPKFLSEKAREPASSRLNERRVSDVADAEILSTKPDAPVMYQNLEMKYSQYGVDDFDFRFYNKTSYSGLEIDIANSYANSLLQVMHFIPLLRNAALQHAASSCANDLCLLCEMGFFFDMLEKAEGTNCGATNLLKAISSHPQAAPLRLLEEDSGGAPLTTMLQRLNRFLLDRMSQDFRTLMPHSAAFDQLLATSATTTIRCMSCRSEHTRPGTTFVNELTYNMNKMNPRNPRSLKVTFSQILKASVEHETTSRGWCSRCQRYQSLATRKTIHGIPAVLIINSGLLTPEAKQLWATPGWLPTEIGVIVEQGQFFCFEGEDLKLHLQRGIHNIVVYSLTGLAADIDNGQHQKSHLVSLINVAHSQPSAPAEPEWHLFNDFLVRPVKQEEALTFNTTWKLPSIISYQIKSANNHIDNSWKQHLDTSLLYRDFNTSPAPPSYRLLDPTDENPGPNTIIALDAEFVNVRDAEYEVNSDGIRETIKPTGHALARVSVLRGSGMSEGEPFIDDYISVKEPILDYVTNFSGIVAEDLDPIRSKHCLVPLKIAYKRLWILLNLGCRFLGHSLKGDFRVINIQVPKNQIIDTVECFVFKGRNRKLRLAWLAHHLLNEDIQQETHDSIEDARTALKLYRKYEEFVDAGILETIVIDLWRKGDETRFKLPETPISKRTLGNGADITSPSAVKDSPVPFNPGS